MHPIRIKVHPIEEETIERLDRIGFNFNQYIDSSEEEEDTEE